MSEQTSGQLAGKVCVIMGIANRWSIAYAIAEAMKAEGATLALSYLDDRMKRDCEALIADHPQGRLYPCDVASDEQLDQLGEALKADFGTVHTLVHSIGFAPANAMKGRFLDTTRDDYRIALDVSAYSLVATAQRIAPLMTEGGSIQTLTYLASQRAFPRYNVMGIAKAALEAVVRMLALELGEQGIRVNALSAGPVKTAAARGIPGFMDMKDTLMERAPIKAEFGAKQVAGLAVFLASDASAAITGDTIFVDNGFHAIGF